MLRITVLLFSFLGLVVNQPQAQSISYFNKDAVVDDIHYLYDKIMDAHFNPYLFINKDDLEKQLDNLIHASDQRDSIEQFDFIIRTMQFLANINDAHTTVQWWKVFPEVSWEAPTFFGETIVINEKSEVFDLNNKQILSINGQAVAQLVKEALSCYGGNDQFRKRFVEKTFFAAFLYFKGLKATFRIKYVDGTSQASTASLNLKELLGRSTDLEDDYRYEIIRDSIGVIYYNSCHDALAFQDFLDSTFKQFKKKSIEKLIIDIRRNMGGNSSLNDLLLSYLTKKKYRQSSTRYWKISHTLKEVFSSEQYKQLFGEKTVKLFLKQTPGSILKEDEYIIKKPKRNKYLFKGKKCLLIGPGTFSSANFLADAVATYNIMPIIGTPTGENTNDFGEQIEIVLPSTKLVVTLSVAFDVGANGQADIQDVVHPDHLIEKGVLNYAIDFLNSEH